MSRPNSNQQRLRIPPGPDEPFDLGATPESLSHIARCFGRYGDTCRVRGPRGKSDTYILHDPDDIKRVLVNNHRNYVKGAGFARVKLLLGNGIFVSQGDFWKRQRTMMQPLFQAKTIQRFYGLITDCNKTLRTRWDGIAAENGELDVTSQTSELTLDIVLRSIFGDDLELIQERFGRNPFDIVAEESARDLKFAYEFHKLMKILPELLQRRRDEKREPADIISALMSARDKKSGAAMTDDELMDEVSTLIIAGHETTASALNWTWYLLSQHPAVERRLVEELAALEGDVPRLDEIGGLGYTRQVLQEAMRLYPPGWVFTRTAIDQDEIGGYDVPAGAEILICLYTLHRHPRYWTDAEEFDPERFGPDEQEQRHRFAYLPFGAGPRRCIGEDLAMFEMQIHLAMLARRFHLRFAERNGPVKAVPAVNLRTGKNLVMHPQAR